MGLSGSEPQPLVPSASRQLDPPGTVYVLIHGTFATGAAWTQESSALSQALRAGDPAARIVRFDWSGRNTHHARWEGGRALAERLDELAREHVGWKQVLVAHSHGGNVALHALARARSKADRRLVALGAPFLTAELRDLKIGLESLVDALLPSPLTVAVLVGAYILLGVLLDFADVSPIDLDTAFAWLTEPWAWLGLLVLLAALWPLRAAGRWVAAHVADSLYPSQREALERIRSGGLPPASRVLCIVAAGDEARAALGTVDRVAALPFALQARARAINTFASDFQRDGLASIESAGSTLRVIRPLAELAGGPVLAAMMVIVSIVVLPIAIASAVLAIVALVVVLAFALMPLFIRMRAVAYWGEALRDGLLVEIAAARQPAPGFAAYEYSLEPPADTRWWELFFYHCHLYQDPAVIADVVNWARSGQVPTGALVQDNGGLADQETMRAPSRAQAGVRLVVFVLALVAVMVWLR